MEKERILFKIKSLNTVMFRKMFGDKNECKEKLRSLPKTTPTQMEIINYILKNQDKDIFQKDLENVLNLRRATVSGVLQTMEKNELIIRVTCKEDSRTKKIILNKHTKDIFAKNQEKVDKLEDVIVSGISKSELELFSKIVDKMISNIENIKDL